MQRALIHAGARDGRLAAIAILGLLAVSMVALVVAPLVLDDSYSWVEHTTSEAAGQGVHGAWTSRSGFLSFGLAVLWLAHRRTDDWKQPATALHVVFGSCLAGVAAFSHRSWQDAVPFDRTEDLMHSVAATVMGFAFAFGVAAVGWTRRRGPRHRPLDVVAVVASVAIPIAMTASTESTGALQRVMFAIAFLWYTTEAVEGLVAVDATNAQ